MNVDRSHRISFLCLLITFVSCQPAPQPQSAPSNATSGLRVRIVNATDYGTFIDVYGNGEVYNSSQLISLVDQSTAIRRIGLHGLNLTDPLPSVWANLSSLRTILIDCAGDAGAAASSTSKVRGRFGSKVQLLSLKELINARMSAKVPNIHNVTIINCGIQGHYGEVWQDYLSNVQVVNLTGNALTGNFTSTEYFKTACNDTFAGDDYGDPDCSSEQTLDVSRNLLSGPISTGAALGDDVTDAVCSTACISLVLVPGVTNQEVLCRAPLLIYALNNPGLKYRAGTRFGSGYVTHDSSNWCYIPASRWVLPTMWSIFLTVLAATLFITLYARVRLKRVPFRMKALDFDVLARGSNGSLSALNGWSAGGRDPAVLSGGYMGLADSVGAVELVERQAMIPKVVGGVSDSSNENGSSLAFVSAKASLSAATQPLPSQPMVAAAAPSLPSVVSGNSLSGRGNTFTNGIGRPGRGSKRDLNGIRVALTAGLEDSSDTADSNGGGVDHKLMPDLDLVPGVNSMVGITLESRAAMVASRTSASGGGVVTVPEGEGQRTWKKALKALLLRALEIIGMQLRTLLILGMFGLECYWAYGLIRFRGGWQLLVLIPNYLEHTLAGIAMLRAFMAGTHGRWKYVAPVPLLPFTMASVYLVYGFIAYPFGWADLGPVSWEKFIDLMDSCGVLSSTCWAIFSSLAYWQGNSVRTSYQYFNTDIFVGMMLMCFTDLLSTAHHLASTLQVPFKQWLRRELDVRKIKVAPDKSHRLQGDSDL